MKKKNNFFFRTEKTKGDKLLLKLKAYDSKLISKLISWI